MSWGRNFIGGIKNVVVQAEIDAKRLLGYAENVGSEAQKHALAAEHALAEAEKETVRRLGLAFEAGGSVLYELGAHIESNGHFNADGTGTAMIKITTAAQLKPAPEAPAPEASAGGEAAKAEDGVDASVEPPPSPPPGI
jgi:hypothetical protein